MADGKKDVKVRLVANGRQDPDLDDGLVGTSGSVSLSVSHLQVLSLGAFKKWETWSPDIRNAFRKRMAFNVVHLFVRRCHGARVAPIAFGSCVMRLMD